MYWVRLSGQTLLVILMVHVVMVMDTKHDMDIATAMDLLVLPHLLVWVDEDEVDQHIELVLCHGTQVRVLQQQALELKPL